MEPVFLIGSHQIKAANQKKCCRLWIGKTEMCLLWSCTASTCGCGNPREQHTPGKASPAATPAPPLPPARAPLGPAPSRQHPGRAGGGAERPQRTGLRSGPEAPEGNGQSRRGRAQPLPPPAGGRDAPTHLRTRRFRLPPPEPRPPCSTCLEATSSRDLRRVARQPHAFPDGAAEAMAAGPGLSRGRRQQLAPPHHWEENNVLAQCFLPKEVDLRQVIVFPKAEWERIQDSLGSTSREAARILAEKKEREEMRLRSKAAVKDWSNTIMDPTERKLKAKQLREERQEEERKLIDLEEAEFQAAQRKAAIDRAKTYLYYQNQRVKGLHSALLLAEVLKERDAQVEFKKLKSDVKKKKDEEKERERKAANLREQEEAHRHYMNQRYMNQQALRRDLMEQIKEHKHQADLAKLEDEREREQIEKSNQLYQLEIEKIMEKEQEEKAERQRLHHEHVSNQKILKAIEEQKEMEENDRIKAHFKAKETIAKMVKKKKAEMRRLTQERQTKIVTQIAAQTSEALKREDDRFARDVAKKEAEYQKKCKEKEAKEKAAIESIREYRATVIKMKAEKEREEKAEGKKELHALMENSRIYLETEKAKKQRQRDASVKVQKIQIQQMAEKQAKKQEEKQAELDYDAQKEVIALCKEREFQKYAKQVIESESKTTHHLYPLLKACKGGRDLGIGLLPEEEKE